MANVTFTVPNKVGSYDGDMVVKQYTSLTINTGDTVTVDAPCRGLFILVQGNCIINGTLSMLGKGAGIDPTASGGSDNNAVQSQGLRFPFFKVGSTDTLTATNTLLNGCGTTARNVIANFRTISGNGIIAQILRDGASGGSGRSGSGKGNNGSNGTTGQSGGGGGGGSYNATSGAGSYGSCFIGGSGGGGADNGQTASSAQTYGRAGGNGGGFGGDSSTGGAGNPNGQNGSNSLRAYDSTPKGGGGLIVLVVGGNLTIGASGLITANGQRTLHTSAPGEGGASGGGIILIGHRGTYTNNGSVIANGGDGGTTNQYADSNGGNGGNGSVQILQIN